MKQQPTQPPTDLEKAVAELQAAVAANAAELAANAALLDEIDELLLNQNPCPYRGLGAE